MICNENAVIRLSSLAIVAASALLLATPASMTAEMSQGKNCGAKLDKVGSIVHAFNQSQYQFNTCDDDGEHTTWNPDFCGEHHYCLDD